MICGCQSQKRTGRRNICQVSKITGLIFPKGIRLWSFYLVAYFRVEIFPFFLPRGSRSGNGRTETLDALHAVSANVLKPYVGDVEGKDVRNSTAPTAEHVAWWRPSSWWGAEDVVCGATLSASL